MFGKSFDEKVKDALSELGSLHIKNLDAKIDGKVVTLSGEASDMATKTRAMQIFNEKVETENTVNLIRIAAPAHAPAPAIVASQTMGPPAPAGSVAHAHAGAGCCGSSAMPGPAVTRTDGSAAAEVRMHEVAKGDTLSAISKKYYGASNQYMKIFDANKDLLKDPDHIYPGQKLRIP